MKIEKINERQIKIFLNQNDLQERNINLNEFAYGSEKAQSLFKDMMEMASEECGFYVDTNRFIIEAIPESKNSIILIITKVSEGDDILDRLGIYKSIQNINKVNTKTLIENENFCVYSFKLLDVLSAAASRINTIYDSKNSLFKYKDIYYLVMDTCDEDKVAYINSILSEYGQRQTASELSEFFFIEHGETIIKNNAISVLSSL